MAHQSKQEVVTEAEERFKAWLEHPVTKDFRQLLRNRRQSLMERFASGNFAASLDAEFIARHAAAQGACSIYKELSELTYQELSEGLESDE